MRQLGWHTCHHWGQSGVHRDRHAPRRSAITLFEPDGFVVGDEDKAADFLDLLHRVDLVLYHRLFFCDEGLDRVGLIGPRGQVELLTDHQLLFQHRALKRDTSLLMLFSVAVF